jgi:hypothetical protein
MQPDHQPTAIDTTTQPQPMQHTVAPAQQPQPANTVPVQHGDDVLYSAIALALSVSISPVGFVLSIIALKKSQPRTPAKTLAKVAFWVSIAVTIFYIAYIALTIMSESSNI